MLGVQVIKRAIRAGAVVATGGLIAVSLFTPAVAASGGAQEPVPGPSDGYSVDESLGWETNLGLVESLRGVDECLYRNAVYPAGGVGYSDGSLPYDDFDAPDRALLTLRAETLRTHPGSVMDVVSTGEAGSVRVTIVALSDPEGQPKFSLDELQAADQDADGAVRTIEASGAEIVVEWVDAPSLLEVCAIQDSFKALTDGNGTPVTSFVIPDALGHNVKATLNVNDVQYAESLAATFGDHLRIEATEDEYILYDRVSDYAPFFGGDRMNLPNGTPWCSTSFRVNGNSILTADHCGYTNFYSGNGNWMGTPGYSQISAAVDAMVLAGSTYSNRVWLGPVTPTSSLPAYGTYPVWTLTPNNSYLLVSGAFSGQGTLTYTGSPSANGCLTISGKYLCALSQTVAPPNICIPGDSGGPVSVYDAANSRLIPTSIVTAGGSNTSVSHQCFVTSVASIAYNYGGATIG